MRCKIEEAAVGATGPVGNTDGMFAFPGYDSTWEYWVDDNSGLLVRTKQSYTHAGDGWSSETSAVISDVGVPNVIEAPI